MFDIDLTGVKSNVLQELQDTAKKLASLARELAGPDMGLFQPLMRDSILADELGERIQAELDRRGTTSAITYQRYARDYDTGPVDDRRRFSSPLEAHCALVDILEQYHRGNWKINSNSVGFDFTGDADAFKANLATVNLAASPFQYVFKDGASKYVAGAVLTWYNDIAQEAP